jgi:hypothetical protein
MTMPKERRPDVDRRFGGTSTLLRLRVAVQ